MTSKSSRNKPISRAESCRGELHPLAREGIELYNRGLYFIAHEKLELAWMETGDPGRRLYQGILQIGLAYYHIQRGNYPGAVKMFAKARRWLEPFPTSCQGVDVRQLLRDAGTAERQLTTLGEERISELDPVLFKPVPVRESDRD